MASPSIRAESARSRSSSPLVTLLHGVDVEVLVGQGVRQLVGDDRLVLVLVEALRLSQEPLEEARALLGLGLGLLDQVHGLGLGVVEGGDLLGVDADHRLLEVQVGRQEAERLHAELVGPELGGGHLGVDLLDEHGLHVLARGDVSLHLVLERDLAHAGEQLLEGSLVADDRLGGLPLIGQRIPLGEEFLPLLDVRLRVVGGRRAREDGQEDPRRKRVETLGRIGWPREERCREAGRSVTRLAVSLLDFYCGRRPAPGTGAIDASATGLGVALALGWERGGWRATGGRPGPGPRPCCAALPGS